ncbi:hypothetical protein [Niabella aquatica]
MIRTIVRPKSNEITLDIPEEYIGKEIEITYLTLDELYGEKQKPEKSMKDFWGTISDEAASKFHNYIKQSRDEWERRI